MKRTPRHTLLWTATALTLLLPALTACTIVSRTVPAADEPITFASFLPDVTKAGVVESAGDMSEFAVWGWHTDAGATQTAIFNRERIYRDATGATGATAPWTYDVPRFWVEGHYDFYAIHPYPDGTDISAPAAEAEVTASCIAGQGISIVLNSPNADIDLMTATADRDYSSADSDASAVAFIFDHLLAKVSIAVRTEGMGNGLVHIQSMVLNGPAEGTYTIQNGAGAWTRTGQGTAFPGWKSGDAGGTPVPDTGITLLKDYMLMPGDPSAFSVTMEYVHNGTSSGPVTISLPEAPIWHAGGSFTYTLTIKGDYIGFDRPLVNGWNDSPGGIIIVD